MKKNGLKQYLNNILGIKSEKNYILEQIQKAKAEMEIANSIFETIEDPILIEAAIFSEHAAKKRYAYFVQLAKESGIYANKEYIIENCTTLAKF